MAKPCANSRSFSGATPRTPRHEVTSRPRSGTWLPQTSVTSESSRPGPGGRRAAPAAHGDGTIAAHSSPEDPMGQELLEELKDKVAVLTLNQPDRLNAMSPPMLDALLEALPRLAADPEIGVVVLTGPGRRFSAGGDGKATADGRQPIGTTLEEKAQGLRPPL